MSTNNDTVQKLIGSVIPSVTGIVVSHPMLTLKVSQQVSGARPKNLYAGMGWYLAKSVPANSISFMMLQTEYVKKMDPWMQGAVSRLTAEALVYPFGLWSQRKQVGLKTGGYFKGIGPTLGRDLVFSTVFVQIHRGWLGDKDIPLPIRIMCAATGASLATQPLDWYKVRAQLDIHTARSSMQMQSLLSGWLWRLAYCNTRSVAAWGLFELLRPESSK